MNPLSESTYLILLALYHEHLHGYGISKSIEKISRGVYIIAPGTLYGVLKNLEKQGLIEALKEEENNRKKKTYCITEQGKDVLQAEFRRYETIIFFTQEIMNGQEF